MSRARCGWLLGALLLPAAGGAAAAGVEVVIACGGQGQDREACQTGAEAWARSTGNTVKLVAVPPDSGQQLTLFQQLFGAASGDVDVFRIDVVWPGILAGHLIDLRPHLSGGELEQHLPALVQNNTVDGKLVALPWFIDVGLLYYRRDLLEKHGQRPPATWQELAATATLVRDRERAAGHKKMMGFVFQGKAYEGLTCNAVEWIASFGGGTVVDEAGQVTVDNPRAVRALELAASLIGPAAPRSVLNYDEEAARGAFQSGQAVFMRNWPYAWSLAQSEGSPVRGKVGVTALPRGGPEGRHAGVLGGWQLGVSRYSRKQAEAIALARYLASPEEQKRRAIFHAFNPSIPALYEDPAVLKANPFLGTLRGLLAHAVARPSRQTGLKYSQVSAELRSAVHATLSGQRKADASLRQLSRRLVSLSNGGTW